VNQIPPLPDPDSAPILSAAIAPAAVLPAPGDAARLPASWQRLPRRGAWMAAIAGAIGMAIVLTLACIALSLLLSHMQGWLWKIPPALAAGGILGAWLSWRRHQRTQWRLDAHSLAVRRAHLWFSDTRVPRARVQHLDVRRGPLERSIGLATLVVHTAGSRLDAVSLSGLELADAETLRELLARPDDHDGL
jgi:uncharacterized protein